MEFASRLQALRKAQNLSQEALADQLGVSRQAIGKWESGSALPSIDNLLELAAILNTTVDYLLTGAEPSPAPSDPLAYQTDETVSIDALKELLAQQVPKKRHRWPYGVLAAVLLVVCCLLGYYIQRVGQLEQTLAAIRTDIDLLDNQMQGSLGSIQAGIQDSLTQQASILSASDVGQGDYDPDTKTAALRLSATPKTLTEDTRLFFVLSPMASSENTLAEPITVEGRIPAVEGPSSGAFTAEAQVPMVQDFAVSVILEQDGFRHTETLTNIFGFSAMYVCTMTAWADNFTWSTYSSTKEITVSGHPSVSIAPAAIASSPKPDTLRSELYIDGVLVESEETDVYEVFYGSRDTDPDQADASLEITFYPGSHDRRSYPTDGNPNMHWKFTLTDTAGNTYEQVVQII